MVTQSERRRGEGCETVIVQLDRVEFGVAVLERDGAGRRARVGGDFSREGDGLPREGGIRRGIDGGGRLPYRNDFGVRILSSNRDTDLLTHSLPFESPLVQLGAIRYHWVHKSRVSVVKRKTAGYRFDRERGTAVVLQPVRVEFGIFRVGARSHFVATSPHSAVIRNGSAIADADQIVRSRVDLTVNVRPVGGRVFDDVVGDDVVRELRRGVVPPVGGVGIDVDAAALRACRVLVNRQAR